MKYPRFTISRGKDIGIRKFKFVAKTQFLYTELLTEHNFLEVNLINLIRRIILETDCYFLTWIQNFCTFWSHSVLRDDLKVFIQSLLIPIPSNKLIELS